jgi:hypothetical protein
VVVNLFVRPGVSGRIAGERIVFAIKFSRPLVCSGLLLPSVPSTVTFTLSLAASYATVMFFVAFGVIFDLDSFSFQVPILGLLAKLAGTATKHKARANTIVFVLMFFLK